MHAACPSGLVWYQVRVGKSCVDLSVEAAVAGREQQFAQLQYDVVLRVISGFWDVRGEGAAVPAPVHVEGSEMYFESL